MPLSPQYNVFAIRTASWAIACGLAALLAAPSPVRAQEGEASRLEEHLETDRDSFTPSTTTAGRGLTIVEAAYSFVDNRVGPEGHSYPELLLRHGIGEYLELRFGWNAEVSGGESVTGSEGGEENEATGVIERERKLAYGLKARLFEQRGFVPEAAVILQATTPTYGPGTATGLVATSVFGWELSERWKLDGSMRYGFASEEGDHFNAYAPSVVLRRSVGHRWNVHAEYFGDFTDGKAEESVRHYFSPGLHYLVTRNLEIGLRLGWGLNDQSANFFSNAGFGWRF